MLKSFSKWSMLNKEYISPFKKGFIQFLQLDTATLSLTFPYYDYLRGLVFIDDTKRIYDEETPLSFDLAALISLLHDDFIYHTQKGVRNHQQTASFLLHAKQTYMNKIVPEQRKTMKRIEGKGNTFAFELEEEEVPEQTAEKDLVIIELSMREAKIQRTEVLLYDISTYLQDEWITVEELITFLYLDFIDKVKREGNNEKVMKSVLKGLDFYKM